MSERNFKLNEVSSSYVLVGDRYIVSFIVGVGQDAETPEDALERALNMIQSEARKTHWYCFDRKTETLQVYLQEEFDPDY